MAEILYRVLFANASGIIINIMWYTFQNGFSDRTIYVSHALPLYNTMSEKIFLRVIGLLFLFFFFFLNVIRVSRKIALRHPIKKQKQNKTKNKKI